MSTDDINRQLFEASVEDRKDGVGVGESKPRKSRVFSANVELQKIAARKPEPSIEEILAAERPLADDKKVNMSRNCSACGGQKRVSHFGIWSDCSKCDGEGLEHYTMTVEQLRADGMEVCSHCGDIYDMDDYCRQCELRAQEGRLSGYPPRV